MAQDGSLSITLGEHTGSFSPWWTKLRIEVVGKTAGLCAVANQRSLPAETTPLGTAFNLADSSQQTTIVVRKPGETACKQ